MAKRSSHVFELARRGAEVRLGELLDEAKLLVQSFPHLRDAFDPDELPISFRLKAAAERGERKALRRGAKSNAAQREGIGQGTKADWAGRRAGKKRR